jgi:hypothetical protein
MLAHAPSSVSATLLWRADVSAVCHRRQWGQCSISGRLAADDQTGREKRRETRVLVASSYYVDRHKHAAHLLFARLTICRAFVRLSEEPLGRMVV